MMQGGVTPGHARIYPDNRKEKMRPTAQLRWHGATLEQLWEYVGPLNLPVPAPAGQAQEEWRAVVQMPPPAAIAAPAAAPTPAAPVPV